MKSCGRPLASNLIDDLLLAETARRLDEGRAADAAQLAALLGFGTPPLEAVPVGDAQHLLQQRRGVAAVVGRAGRRLVGKRLLGQQVAAPQFDAVDAGEARRLVDQPLREIRHARTAGAAIRRGRRGIGEDETVQSIDRRRAVDVGGHGGRRRRRVGERAGVRRVGADIHQPLDPHPEKLPVAIERKLAAQRHAAPMVIAQERFGAGAGPLDRAIERARREGERGEFRIDLVAHAEPAADILGVNAELLGRQAGDMRELLHDVGHALGRHVDVEASGLAVEGREPGFRLHRNTGEIVEHGASCSRRGPPWRRPLPWPRGCRTRNLSQGCRAHRHAARRSGASASWDRSPPASRGIRPTIVLGGVLRVDFVLGDHERNRLADEWHPAVCKRRPMRIPAVPKPSLPLKNMSGRGLLKPAFARSSPENTPSTPGIASSLASSDTISACARSARRKCPRPGPAGPSRRCTALPGDQAKILRRPLNAALITISPDSD